MALTTALGAGAVQVQYDGRTPWGAAPPYVSIDREPIFYGGKWGQVAKITLTGEISQYAYLYDLIKMGACDPTVPASPGCFFTDGSPFEITLEYPKGLKNLEKIRDDIIETFSNSLRTFEFEDTQVPPNKMEFDNVILDLKVTREDPKFTKKRLKFVAGSRARKSLWVIKSMGLSL